MNNNPCDMEREQGSTMVLPFTFLKSIIIKTMNMVTQLKSVHKVVIGCKVNYSFWYLTETYITWQGRKIFVSQCPLDHHLFEFSYRGKIIASLYQEEFTAIVADSPFSDMSQIYSLMAKLYLIPA